VKAAFGSALVFAVALLVIYMWWFQPGWVLALTYSAICLLSLITIPLCYRFFGYQDADGIEALIKREQREHTEMLAHLDSLKKNLGDMDNEEGANQVNTLGELLNDFHEVIANRFRGKQLSAGTYLNAARQVQNQCLQNLSDMVGIGHSIASLKRQPSPNDNPQLEEQNQRLESLIRENKTLFAALSDTSVVVANIQEIGDFERTETLAKLHDLANIARQQSH